MDSDGDAAGDSVTILETILSSQITPITLMLLAIVAIIFIFAKGWVVSRFQVETLLAVQNLRIDEAVKRGNDWQAAYVIERDKNEVLLRQLDKLAVVGEAVDRLITALPHPGGQQ